MRMGTCFVSGSVGEEDVVITPWGDRVHFLGQIAEYLDLSLKTRTSNPGHRGMSLTPVDGPERAVSRPAASSLPTWDATPKQCCNNDETNAEWTPNPPLSFHVTGMGKQPGQHPHFNCLSWNRSDPHKGKRLTCKGSVRIMQRGCKHLPAGHLRSD